MDSSRETERLYAELHHLGWSRDDCELIAPVTLEINELKHEQHAVILAHSYQTPDIMYGVGDYIGDSYGLSVRATKHPARKIIFCSVYFMGETAKLLHPGKDLASKNFHAGYRVWSFRPFQGGVQGQGDCRHLPPVPFHEANPA